MEKSQARQLGSASAREARVRSRHAFRGLSAAQARAVLVRRHPSVAAQPGWLDLPGLSPLALATPIGRNLLRVDGGARPDSIVLSAQPLAFRDAEGQFRKIDLGLRKERTGALVADKSPFAVSLPETLDEGIAVGAGDRRFSIRPDVTRSGNVAREQYAAFYGDVDPDTDFVVKPVLGGVETFSILRSPASPESLRLRFNGGKGSELRTQSSVDGFVLSRRGEDLAMVSPPKAWDAQQRPVAVRASIEGGDLVLRVPHRDKDVAYPVVVDPVVVDTCSLYVAAGTGCQVDDWEGGTHVGDAGWAYQGDGRFAPLSGAGYLGSGLYIRNLAQNYYTAGEAGYWFYRAPWGVRIWSALFSNLSQDNLGDNTSCLFVGVLENNGVWGRSSPGTYCAQQTLDQSFRWCPGTSCWDSSGGTPGNAALFGAMAQRTGWSSYWMDHMGGAAIALTEMDWPALNPYVSSPDFPDDWQTDPNRAITIHAGDAGLGLKSITISSPDNPSWQPIDADTGGSANRSFSSCTGGTRLACPMDSWIRVKVGRLREGYSTIRVRAVDMVNKSYTYEHAIGVRSGASDPFPPNLTLSGPAVDNRTQLDFGGWDLEASAVDGAGVASMELLVDGVSDGLEQTNGCAGCTVGAEFTVDTDSLGPGGHTVSVVATDGAGNQTTNAFAVQVPVTVTKRSISSAAAGSAQGQVQVGYVRPTACADAPPFAAHYAGLSVAGFALTHSVSSCARGEGSAAGDHSISYAYGTCDASEGPCATPVTITSRPLCEAHPKLYLDETGAELPYTSMTVKGVPAASYDDGTTVEVYTGGTAVSVSSEDAATTTAVVDALRRASTSDTPAPGVSLTSWPLAGTTRPATTLVAPDATTMDESEARCA